MTSFGFDVGGTKPQTSFAPLPPGWYAMRVTKVDEVMSPKPGTGGRYLKLTFEIIDHAHPDYAGRMVWANFFHLHDSKQTRDIARGQIAAICHAVGKPNAQSTEEILGGELRVQLKVTPATEQYEAKNEARGFKSLSDVVEQQPSAPATAGGSTTTAPAAGKPSQPWKR